MRQTLNLKTLALNVTEEPKEMNPVCLTCLVVGVTAERWNNYTCILIPLQTRSSSLWIKNFVNQMILGTSKESWASNNIAFLMPTHDCTSTPDIITYKMGRGKARNYRRDYQVRKNYWKLEEERRDSILNERILGGLVQHQTSLLFVYHDHDTASACPTPREVPN